MSPAVAEERTVRYEALEHQLKALSSTRRTVVFFGGVGSGKTDCGSIWSLGRVAESPPGVLGCIAANTYPQLYDSTLRNVFKNWDRMGVSYLPREIPISHRPVTLRVRGNGGWRDVLCRSLDHYQTLSGTELGWAWMDEVFQTERAAFHLVQARVRDGRMPDWLRQILLTSTLDDPTTWMYDTFVDNYDADRMEVIYATSYDNPFLPAGYVEDLKASYDERLFRRMCLAQWVALQGQTIYHAFSRDRNMTEEAEFDPALPICWSHDFNIGVGKPMSSVLCQVKKGEHGPELHVFDELILDSSDTNDAVSEMHGRPWVEQQPLVRVYGDPAGKARDTRSKKTDYAILAEAGFTDQRVASTHPPIRDRHNAVNALLCSASGVVRLKVHPRCKALIKGLETVVLREGAQYLEKETREQHVTTALGYLVCKEFPVAGQKPRTLSMGEMMRRRVA